MNDVEKLYDIRLALSKEDSELLLCCLEVYASEIDDEATHSSGSKALKIVDSIDNIASAIALCLPDEKRSGYDVAGAKIIPKNNHGWWYKKG